MKISFLTGALAGAVVVTAGSALAGYHMYEAAHSAKVLSVKPLTRTVKTPRQDCHDETVTHTKPVQDQNRLIGTGLGAVVGGLLGHQVGGGIGKTLATVAGAAAGGYAAIRFNRKPSRAIPTPLRNSDATPSMTVKRSQRGLMWSMNTKAKSTTSTLTRTRVAPYRSKTARSWWPR